MAVNCLSWNLFKLNKINANYIPDIIKFPGKLRDQMKSCLISKLLSLLINIIFYKSLIMIWFDLCKYTQYFEEKRVVTVEAWCHDILY